MSTPSAPEADSLGAIGKQIADDAARLVRSEIELIKAEAKATAIRAGVAIGMFVGAVLFLLFMMVFALAQLPERFGASWFGSPWKGWGIFAVAWLLVAGALALIGVRFLRRALSGGKEAAASLKEDVQWLKQLPKRNDRSS